jgi:hypothetical protein
MPDGSVDGEYRLSGNDLAMDFPIGSTSTTITEQNGLLVLPFANVFVEGQGHLFVLTSGTIGGSAPDPAPGAPDPQPQQPQPQQPQPQQPDPPAPSQNAPVLEGTIWEIVRAESPEGFLDRDGLVQRDFLIEFHFGSNGAVTCRGKNNGPWSEERGTYQLSGNTLSINIPSLNPMTTTIQNNSFILTNFNNNGEDYTFQPTSSPASSQPSSQPSSPGSGIPQVIRDFWWGGALGAIAGVIIWAVGKKKKAAAASEHAPTPYGQTPAPPAYNPMPAPAPSFGAQPQLHCSSGPMAGATFPVSGSLRMGRDPSRCQIIFPAETKGISSLHCEVLQQPSGILLTDHGSTYGTFLSNGRKLNANESVTLNSGDSFYLADRQNSFRVL